MGSEPARVRNSLPGAAKRRGAADVVAKMAEMERKREERRARIEEERRRREADAEMAANFGGIDSVEFARMIDAYRKEHKADGAPPSWRGPRTVWDLPTKSRIRVCVRKRPMLPRELRAEFDSLTILPPAGDLAQHAVVHEPKLRVDTSKEVEHALFSFDGCFSEADTNASLFGAVGMPQMIEHVLAGNSATVFCFGQTGSGKTVTMVGLTGQDDGANGLGLYGLAAQTIFERKAEAEARGAPPVSVLVSLYEIYRGCVHDLLNKRARLDVRDDAKGRTWVAGLSIVQAADAKAVNALIRAAQAARATSATAANSASSRSHAVLQVRTCTADDAQRALLDGQGGGGKLCLVDLAGSERAADAAASDQQTRIEGAEINKSLLCLKECIRALDAGHRHLPFRGSKLTHVLKESFSGDARTVMIANLAPGSASVENTLNSLRYAARVKAFSHDGAAAAEGIGPLQMDTPLPPPARAGAGGTPVASRAKGTAARPQSAPPKKASLPGGGGGGGGSAEDDPVGAAAQRAEATAAALGEAAADKAAMRAAAANGARAQRPRSRSATRGALGRVDSEAALGLEAEEEREAIEMLRRSAALDGAVGSDELGELEYLQAVCSLSQVEAAMVEQHRQALLADEALLKQERLLLQEMDQVDRPTADYVRDLEAIVAAKLELSLALQGQLVQFKSQLHKEERHNQKRLSRRKAQGAQPQQRSTAGSTGGSSAPAQGALDA